MEFDKTRVYTAFNADEVEIGSKGYFSDYKENLIDRVLIEDEGYYGTLQRIEDCNDFSFRTARGGLFRYFYLVKEPKKKTKRPCTREELIEILKKQGLPMLKWYNDSIYLVDELFDGNCKINDIEYTYSELCADFTLIDGTELWIKE